VKVPGIPVASDESPLLVPQSGSPRGTLRRPIIQIFLGCALATIFAWAVYVALKGDAERLMTIRTNLNDEGGPLVIVDGAEVGYSPLPASFIYYPGREIRLIKDGCETVTSVERDIVCHFEPPGNVDELLQRAHKLRTEAQLKGEPRPDDLEPVVSGSKLEF